MSLIVQKFGGTSVADTHHIFNVAKKAISFYKNGHDVIVVVSAQGDTTDKLIEKAKEIGDIIPQREMDALLSTGEQISASLLAMAIQSFKIPAVSLTGWQVGIKTDKCYSNAQIISINKERIQNELNKRKIVVVTGFQGINDLKDITTLGRGGSDTSAVAIAGIMNADVCKIYTDVDGVYTADPRIVNSARKLDSISYNEMFKMAYLGAQVLNDVSIKTAQKYKVEVEVLSSMKSDSQGTIIKEIPVSEIKSLSGIAIEKDLIKLTVSNLEDIDAFKSDVLDSFIEKHFIKDKELKCVGHMLPKCVSVLVESSKFSEFLNDLKEKLKPYDEAEIFYEKDKAKISVVNLADSYNVNIASIVFESLNEANINIEMTACDEERISVVVSKENLHHAVNIIHNKLFEEDYLI